MSAKLERMPGVKLSPEFLLHAMLGHIDKIESIALVVQWKGDEFQVCSSNMKTTLLVVMGAYLAEQAMKEFTKESE